MTKISFSNFNFKQILPYMCGTMVVLIFIFSYFNFSYCKVANPARNSYGKSVIIEKEKIDQSYTLLAPFASYKYLGEEGKVYLLDLFGKPVHQWKTQYQPFYAALKKNGNLIVASIFPANLGDFPGGGKTGIIQEIDWQSKIIWEYRNDYLHHDFEILPNDNIVAFIWERVPKNIAKEIRGGMPETEFKGDVWSDALIEISRSGEIVWIWHAYEYLDPQKDVLGPLTPRSEWTHSNSVRYIKKDPFENDEAFLVSLRHINTIALIKKKDGRIIWKSPQSLFAYQHDATFLDNGNILVFDNGQFRKQGRPFLWSRVIEINPKTNKIVWEFNGGESGTEKARFAASILSGAQRLGNGNTLIINGPHGHLFEVTPEGKVVWDLINPFATYTMGAWPNNTIFKARRYRPEEINWPKKIGKPLPFLSLVCDKINN